ncbi:4'-phosphopantetheinyl transferase [Oceanisphaera litoralis]|uniref:4'-phosphopantetheinyl transferase family protein n=1 Tax=Oceanisphaera litoralis TaxID=225144 RepID=UPI001957E89C|nr:4'-phosphopantetheinyl transferase superfamily protein [Oceanisphaera litoralis]MBM7454422.1 4'-phosphopantetheinyl transferase [Oceanisphaera litoralis]
MSENKDIFTDLLILDSNGVSLPDNARKTLSQAELARLDRISHPRQARLFLLGRYLLRQRLAERLMLAPNLIPVHIDVRGKPLLEEQAGWHFNISHSGDILALAIGNRGSLGVDIEGRQLSAAQITRLARRYLSEQEQQWLSTSQASSADFIRLWTVKEAVLKAHGGGIANNLQRVHWQPDQADATLDRHPYRLYQYPLAHSWLTLAIDDRAGSSGGLGWPEPALLNPADLPFELEITGPQPNLSVNSQIHNS